MFYNKQTDLQEFTIYIIYSIIPSFIGCNYTKALQLWRETGDFQNSLLELAYSSKM